jgi:outer membrane protein
VDKKTVLVLAVFCANPAFAEEQPKWELGAGLGSQTLADYRGSEHYQTSVVPIPFIIYRGDFLQADDDGIRGLFFNSDRFELDVSLAGSLNGDSEGNDLRRGMPELHPSAEIGPSFNVNLTGSDFNEGWSLRLPVRAVYGFDFDEFEVDHIGYLANPQLTYEDLDWKGWEGSLDLGFLYGSEDYHEYYYSVESQYATSERPEYSADSGFSGSYFSFSMTRREGKLWYGGYLRYDNLSGASFEESPLVETDHFFTLGLGVSLILRQSREQVPVRSKD